jgi:hypothetical protein
MCRRDTGGQGGDLQLAHGAAAEPHARCACRASRSADCALPSRWGRLCARFKPCPSTAAMRRAARSRWRHSRCAGRCLGLAAAAARAEKTRPQKRAVDPDFPPLLVFPEGTVHANGYLTSVGRRPRGLPEIWPLVTRPRSSSPARLLPACPFCPRVCRTLTSSSLCRRHRCIRIRNA